MGKRVVVDTNVAICANGKNTHASKNCQLKCIEVLDNCKKLYIALDRSGLIMKEYAKHLSYAGEPGVGDMFFKYLHDYQYTSKKIITVDIHPANAASQGFDELPPNSLDPSDRKFLATAIVAQAKIINATDTDWAEQSELLNTLGILVEQLCPEHGCKITN